MGKPREASTDRETSAADMGIVVPCQKRHKKHKHKRHKRKKIVHDDEDGFVGDGITLQPERGKNSKARGSDRTREKIPSGNARPATCTIGSSVGIGGILGTSSAGDAPSPASTTSAGTHGSGPSIAIATPPKITIKKKISKGAKGKESGTSSEEERWLDAIESGKLEEVDDELKKIKPKDPKLMTARQRAMFERKTDTEPNPAVERLVSLPSGYKEKVMTAEAIQKAALKSLKRKQLADEKREKDKKKTMERLLKKQESKASKFLGKGRASKRQVPLITYRLTIAGSSISLPAGQEFPLNSTTRLKAAEISSTTRRDAVPLCGVEKCNQPKRYSCSKTGVGLCSLECYKANLAATST